MKNPKLRCLMDGDVRLYTVYFLILSSSSTSRVLSANLTSDFHNTSATMSHILHGYDKTLRPLFGGPSVNVQVTLFVGAFGLFDTQESIYDINFYLRQTWKDSRLSFSSNSSKKVSLNPSFLQHIWVPDTTFVNVKQAELHFVTKANQLVYLWPNGEILTSTRVTAKAYCRLKLHDYPFDKQKCNLIFGSYGYDKSDIDYFWKYKDKTENVKFGEHARMNQFTLEDFDALRTEKGFGETGIFAKLSLEFTLKRELGFFIINLYFPATLLVILSWVSFWLRRDQTPARVALGITTALTLMTLISGSQSHMPKVPYIRAIDWFLVICFFCVIGALLEYAAVHYFEKELLGPQRRRYKVHNLSMDNHSGTVGFGTFQTSDNNGHGLTNPAFLYNDDQPRGSKTVQIVKRKMARNVNTIDRISRTAFPLVFVSLNCVYWSIYLS